MVVFLGCRKLLSSQGAAELPRLLPVGGGGRAGHTLVVPSDITNMFEPRQMVVYYVSRGSLPFIRGTIVGLSIFLISW